MRCLYAPSHRNMWGNAAIMSFFLSVGFELNANCWIQLAWMDSICPFIIRRNTD